MKKSLSLRPISSSTVCLLIPYSGRMAASCSLSLRSPLQFLETKTVRLHFRLSGPEWIPYLWLEAFLGNGIKLAHDCLSINLFSEKSMNVYKYMISYCTKQFAFKGSIKLIDSVM